MSYSLEVNHHQLLNRWRYRMEEDIWNFNQLLNDKVPSFGGVYVQRERELIAHALADAYEEVVYYLGFNPQPTFIVDQQVDLRDDVAWDRQTLDIDSRYLSAFGKRELLSVGELDFENFTQSIDYDGDGFNEVLVHDISLDADLDLFDSYTVENARTYLKPEDHRPIHSDIEGDPLFEVPLHQRGSNARGSQVEWSFHVHVANRVKLSVTNDAIYLDNNGRPYYKRDDDGVFVDEADVFIPYANPDNAVTLLSWVYDGADSYVAETEVNAIILNKKFGEFRLVLKEDYPPSKPFAVRVSYMAGFASDIDGGMDSELERAIIQLANTNMVLHELPLSHYTAEIRRSDILELFTTPNHIPRELANPLGTRRGHLEAWTIIKRYADLTVGRAQRWT